jgi:hypothetical protein
LYGKGVLPTAHWLLETYYFLIEEMSRSRTDFTVPIGIEFILHCTLRYLAGSSGDDIRIASGIPSHHSTNLSLKVFRQSLLARNWTISFHCQSMNMSMPLMGSNQSAGTKL